MIRQLLEKYRRDGVSSLVSAVFAYASRRFISIYFILCTKIFEFRYGTGVDVMTWDWDTLVILDACRYDEFALETSLTGDLQRVVSAGRESYEFIQENFLDKRLHDTVYVTANPHRKFIKNGIFHAIIDEPLQEQFDEELGTVCPADVTAAALDAHERFPNKRLIIHYMQPHMPPIGSIRSELSQYQPGFNMRSGDSDFDRFFNLVDHGEISSDDAQTAYRQNLNLVLNEIERIREIDGKTAITSDHGELLGEQPCRLMRSSWSHQLTQNESPLTPSRFPKCQELCCVPWFVIDTDGERREIIAEKPVDTGRISESTANQRLEALGYRMNESSA